VRTGSPAVVGRTALVTAIGRVTQGALDKRERGLWLEARGAEKSPADNLPPYISRLTDFGERADFSHDGKKILFLAKTYGDAYEIDIATIYTSN